MILIVANIYCKLIRTLTTTSMFQEFIRASLTRCNIP